MQSHIHLHPKYHDLDPGALFTEAGDSGSAGIKGRGKVAFLSIGGHEFVRKHYSRGGWVRKLVRDQYAYTGIRRTRMAREFELLNSLRDLGLPVPEPVAIRCLRPSPITYSGDLVTARIQDAESLGTRLRRQPLPPQTWAGIGATIGRFHRHGVYHADLNIENILLGNDAGIYLLDFDRGRFVRLFKRFRIGKNMDRLLRSLHKEAARSWVFHFSTQDWKTLVRHHREELTRDP